MLYFGTLMWIDPNNHSAINSKNKSIRSYFRQADVLAKTLRTTFGVELYIFTNQDNILRNWLTRRNAPIPQIVKISSTLSIPAGLAFYGAHHKVDALRAGVELLKADEDRFFLLDSDVVALRAFNSDQKDFLTNAEIAVYDISDQAIAAYNALKCDLELVAGRSFAFTRWFGGEFIGGSKAGLQKLIIEVEKIMPAYFTHLPYFHHVGDELFFSAALLSLPERLLANITPYRILSRHWSRHTDPSLSWHTQHSFIHCPGSKPALEFLSQFKNPSPTFITVVLSVYQSMVLAYQASKKLWRFK